MGFFNQPLAWPVKPHCISSSLSHVCLHGNVCIYVVPSAGLLEAAKHKREETFVANIPSVGIIDEDKMRLVTICFKYDSTQCISTRASFSSTVLPKGQEKLKVT